MLSNVVFVNIVTVLSILIVAMTINLIFFDNSSQKPVKPLPPINPPNPPVNPDKPRAPIDPLQNNPKHILLPKVQQTDDSKQILAYLMALYPQSGNFASLLPTAVLNFYDNLMWYYLPMLRKIPETRQGPLKGPFQDASCQWFMADGADCGNPPTGTDTFTCTVFGGDCTTSEFGKATKDPVTGEVTGADGGRSYQYAAFIKPYDMRDGCPSNGYIECVAFVCEGLGKQLLTAGLDPNKNKDYFDSVDKHNKDPNSKIDYSLQKECFNKPPTWDEFLNNQKRGTNQTNDASKMVENYVNILEGDSSGANAFHADAFRGNAFNATGDVDCTFPKQTSSCDTPDHQNPGCKIRTDYGVAQSCCWDYEKSVASDDACPFPAKCSAVMTNVAGKNSVSSNFCETPCGYENCDVTSGCDWMIDDKSWVSALEAYSSGGTSAGEFLKSHLLMKTVPVLQADKSNPAGRKDAKVNPSTMFYWCKGYGKFLNMEKTGIYFNYVHLMLTSPKKSVDGKKFLRWSFPQLLQARTLNGGSSTMITQLTTLVGNGKLKDFRKYLEGYCTTLRDKPGEYKYTPKEGEVVQNKMKYPCENVNGLINPLDDDNLKAVDKYTVTKYYDPDLNIENPQYMKVLNYTPLQAIYLQQAMHIYGATSSSRKKPYVNMSHVKRGDVDGSGTWPFGVFYEGASTDTCVAKLIDYMGWRSAQFTQMPTGSGSAKYCNSPEMDFEIVYIWDKTRLCSNMFLTLDPVADLENYTKNGFVDGNKLSPEELNAIPLDASKMSLTERNVPDNWKGKLPNELLLKYFNNNQAVNTVPYSHVCPYIDNVFAKKK
jgi:hypothetical protein